MTGSCSSRAPACRPTSSRSTRLNIDDPTEAKAAVIKAIQDNDTAKLKPLSDFWSVGFDAVEMPTGDKADITLGNGAYTVTDFKKDEYITLKARADGLHGWAHAFRGEHHGPLHPRRHGVDHRTAER